MGFVSKRVENFKGNGEKCGFQHFLFWYNVFRSFISQDYNLGSVVNA